jgi:serine/threonine-protein kinase
MGNPADPKDPITRRLAAPAAGLADTLDAPAAASPEVVALLGQLDEPGAESPRYQIEHRLGEGGMGTVVLCSDQVIGRRVAMKLIRGEDGNMPAEVEARFLREARIQGQLEHPSIVPVYDMGRDPQGAAFFTMKRVGGVTLAEVIERLRRGDPIALETFTLRRRLEAFSRICLAIEFAHERGVLHRDLKPANLMLGDFGEVYVLDWGIARVNGDGPAQGAADVERVALTSRDHFLGTVGYASPEQMSGEPLGAASDIYSLGAVLFELLTLQPLHTEPSSREVMVAIAAGRVEARCSLRAPERALPPELDAICVRATAAAAAARFPSARALNDQLVAYLDGERDLALRRAMARRHLEAAQRSIGGSEPPTNERRQDGLRQLGRALALDPDNPESIRVLLAMLAQSPRELPPQIQEEMERDEEARWRSIARVSVLAWVSIVPFAPLFLLSGVRSWAALLAFWGSALLAALVIWRRARAQRQRPRMAFFTFAANMLVCLVAATMFGPLLLSPSWIAIATLGSGLLSRPRYRAHLLIAGFATLLLPVVAQAIGVWPRSYSFVDGGLFVHPLMLGFSRWATTTLLVLGNLFAIAIAWLIAINARDAVARAERRLYEQRWQLQQLAPAEVQTRSEG